MIEKVFKGVFKNEFEKFILYKQSLGHYKDFESKRIYEFISLNEFLDSYNLNEIKITKEMVDDYIEKNSYLSQGSLHYKESLLRQFSKFLISQGYEDIYISYQAQVKMPRDYIPYVFSDEEITKIFQIIDQLKFKNNLKLTLFYQTLFRLLYCTGLRIGEALNLKIDDVDLENNIITIHSGKGNVSRMVPFKPSLGWWLSEYKNKYFNPTDMYFFESPKGGKRSTSTIRSIFKDLVLVQANIKSNQSNGHKRGACLHSLRHAFACNALDQMIKEGKDPYCSLPYLSVYLGHTSIVNTEIYLRLTMQRYDEIINAGHYIYQEGLGDSNE